MGTSIYFVQMDYTKICTFTVCESCVLLSCSVLPAFNQHHSWFLLLSTWHFWHSFMIDSAYIVHFLYVIVS